MTSLGFFLLLTLYVSSPLLMRHFHSLTGLETSPTKKKFRHKVVSCKTRMNLKVTEIRLA